MLTIYKVLDVEVEWSNFKSKTTSYFCCMLGDDSKKGLYFITNLKNGAI